MPLRLSFILRYLPKEPFLNFPRQFDQPLTKMITLLSSAFFTIVTKRQDLNFFHHELGSGWVSSIALLLLPDEF